MGNTCVDILRHPLELDHLPITSLSGFQQALDKDFGGQADPLTQEQLA